MSDMSRIGMGIIRDCSWTWCRTVQHLELKMETSQYGDFSISICSSSHLNRLLSLINIAPTTNLFPKYHMSQQSRTCVKWDANNNKKVKKINCYTQQFIFQTSIVKQLELGSLCHLGDCLVLWLRMHFCKNNQQSW